MVYLDFWKLSSQQVPWSRIFNRTIIFFSLYQKRYESSLLIMPIQFPFPFFWNFNLPKRKLAWFKRRHDNGHASCKEFFVLSSFQFLLKEKKNNEIGKILEPYRNIFGKTSLSFSATRSSSFANMWGSTINTTRNESRTNIFKEQCSIFPQSYNRCRHVLTSKVNGQAVISVALTMIVRHVSYITPFSQHQRSTTGLRIVHDGVVPVYHPRTCRFEGIVISSVLHFGFPHACKKTGV